MLQSILKRVLFLLPGKGDSDVRTEKKWCFSKKLLVTDYAVLAVMLLMQFIPYIDKTNLAIVTVAWIAQIAISSGCYYWKAKSENLIKLVLWILKDLPDDMKEKADPNSIIASVLGIGTSNNN